MARTRGRVKYRGAISPISSVILGLLASSVGGYICSTSICEHVPTCEIVHRGPHPQLAVMRRKRFRARTARRRSDASGLLREAFRCPATLYIYHRYVLAQSEEHESQTVRHKLTI
jgi:hypothetical protein